MTKPLDPKRPWITDQDDLFSEINWFAAMFNPAGRSSRVPFRRLLFIMLLLNILLVPATIVTLFVARPVGVFLLFVHTLLSIISFINHMRRMSDAGGISRQTMLIVPNLIMAPATLLSLLIPWPFTGVAWTFGLGMLCAHAVVTLIGIFWYASVPEGQGRGSVLGALALAPLMIAGAMFAYQAQKGVTVANGIVAMQKLGGAAAKAQENARRAEGARSGRPRGGARRGGGRGGPGGGPPQNMKPMDMVVGMALMPTLAVWTTTAFGLFMWSLAGPCRLPRAGQTKPDQERVVQS